MTDYKIEKFPFDPAAIAFWAEAESLGANWPVVYTLSNDKQIYVGETLSAVTRLNQHLATAKKKSLNRVQIILNEKFNKSVCLDLESQLIQYLAADGTHQVLNANSGIRDANYYDRDKYRESFNELFDALVADGLLSKSIPEIVNSNLFKFSPFKAVTLEQAAALNGIIERIVEDLKQGGQSQLIVQGDPGTGKTIVAIYLIKLLRDIARATEEELLEDESIFAEFFTPELSELFDGLKIALVVPQQALRKTLEGVFTQTPGLHKDMVLTPFEVAESKEDFDILIVDEAHRLGQRANQNSAMQKKKFTELNIKLFGSDDKTKTQLDWIQLKSRHQLLLLDTAQSIRPGDLPLDAELARERVHEAHQRVELRVVERAVRVLHELNPDRDGIPCGRVPRVLHRRVGLRVDHRVSPHGVVPRDRARSAALVPRERACAAIVRESIGLDRAGRGPLVRVQHDRPDPARALRAVGHARHGTVDVRGRARALELDLPAADHDRHQCPPAARWSRSASARTRRPYLSPTRPTRGLDDV
jgi:hypothetical protein